MPEGSGGRGVFVTPQARAYPFVQPQAMVAPLSGVVGARLPAPTRSPDGCSGECGCGGTCGEGKRVPIDRPGVPIPPVLRPPFNVNVDVGLDGGPIVEPSPAAVCVQQPTPCGRETCPAGSVCCLAPVDPNRPSTRSSLCLPASEAHTCGDGCRAFVTRLRNACFAFGDPEMVGACLENATRFEDNCRNNTSLRSALLCGRPARVILGLPG